MKTHVCSKCNRRRPAAEFYKKADKGWIDADGIHRNGVCRECWYERVRERRETKPRKASKPPSPRAVNRRTLRELDAGPFREWLQIKMRHYGSYAQVAFATGVNERRIRSVLSGEHQKVSLLVVDTALTIEGSAFLFELYPDLYPGLDAATLADVLRVGIPATHDEDHWYMSVGDEVVA